MGHHTRTPNDQRSDAKNPTSSENKAAKDNHANQINPNHQASKNTGERD
jgi:hypothetical protein